MSPRAVTSVVLVALLGQVSLVGCRRDSDLPQVTGRWPVSAPVDLLERLSAARRMVSPLAPGESAEVLSPGVRIREGQEAGLFYLEVVMGEADFETPLPLVLLLHGRGDRPRVPGGPFAHVPTPLRLLLPRAPLPLGEGYTWIDVSITDGNPEALAKALAHRARHLAVFLERVGRQRPVLGRPILAGFSQGAMLTYTLAVQRPETFNFAFPLVGWLPPGLWPAERPADEPSPMLRSVHGTADSVMPIGPTRHLVEILRARRWPAELREFDGVGHVMTPKMNATFEVWLEQAAEHEAPGFGGGLGQPGPEADRYQPFEPL